MICGSLPSSRWSPPPPEATSNAALCAPAPHGSPTRGLIFFGPPRATPKSARTLREPGTYLPVRALGLDVGSKKIGVALTDEASIAAHPLTVLERVGNSGDSVNIAALVAEHGVTDLVVGIPYELSGRVGHRVVVGRAGMAAGVLGVRR